MAHQEAERKARLGSGQRPLGAHPYRPTSACWPHLPKAPWAPLKIASPAGEQLFRAEACRRCFRFKPSHLPFAPPSILSLNPCRDRAQPHRLLPGSGSFLALFLWCDGAGWARIVLILLKALSHLDICTGPFSVLLLSHILYSSCLLSSSPLLI